MNVSIIGSAYHLTPDNIEFNTPIEIKISYREYDISISNEDNLGIITFNGNNWTYLDSKIDKENKIVSAETSHFSIFAIAPNNKKIIGEISSITTNQPDGNSWHTINLNNNYIDLVVIMQPLSFNEQNPAHIRIKNVSSESFEFQIEEWNYLDQIHNNESVSYLVIEKGTHILEDGTKIEAGITSINNEFTQINFLNHYDSKPIVLTQSQTYNGSQAIVTRQKDITNSGFKVKLQEEENSDSIHKYENIGYVAIEQKPNGTNNGNKFETRKTSKIINQRGYLLNFAQNYSVPPLFLASIGTYIGTDTSEIRYKDITQKNIKIKISEEQSKDKETLHTYEAVNYMVFEKPGNILATS